jgi:hypothetical protein
VGALVAAPAALALGLFSIFGGLGLGAFLHGARSASTVALTLARIALVHVTPTVGASVAAGGAVVVAILAVAIRILVGGATGARPVEEVVR